MSTPSYEQCPKCGAPRIEVTAAEVEWACGSYLPKGCKHQQSEKCEIVVLSRQLAEETHNKNTAISLHASAVELLREADEVAQWAQAILTALNTGDVKSGSPLHLKLREVMIAYRNSIEQESQSP